MGLRIEVQGNYDYGGMVVHAGVGAVLRTLRDEGLKPPKILNLAITGRCNLHCAHCLVMAGGRECTGDVPVRLLRRLLSDFASLEGEGILLTGGEPLCHPDWLQLLQFAKSLGLDNVVIQTNGMLWSAAEAEAVQGLEFNRLVIQVSLDGATAASHDTIRGAGSFNETLAGLKLLVRSGLADAVELRFTEMHHNLEEFPDLLMLARELGVAKVVSGSLVVAGRASGGGKVLPPEPGQYLQLRQRWQEDDGFREIYLAYGTMAHLEWGRELLPRCEGCTFVEHPYVSAEGRLYPCPLCLAESAAVDGLWGRSLSSLLRAGAARWGRLVHEGGMRSMELDVCRSCQGLEVCAAGCLGRALTSFGKVSAPDDRCAVRRVIYDLASSERT
jgi:radical SAM protein with 4Fe4S-binding SPASM domain